MFFFTLVGWNGTEDLTFDLMELLGCGNCGVVWIMVLEEATTTGCCSCLVLCIEMSTSREQEAQDEDWCTGLT